jgi:hypothetical protein
MVLADISSAQQQKVLAYFKIITDHVGQTRFEDLDSLLLRNSATRLSLVRSCGNIVSGVIDGVPHGVFGTLTGSNLYFVCLVISVNAMDAFDLFHRSRHAVFTSCTRHSFDREFVVLHIHLFSGKAITSYVYRAVK